jgi:CheY-like chemotaxis protein
MDLIRFSVADTGAGVPEDLQHRLFRDFSQADSSISRQFGGSGLGLAICKRLVQLMGGNIGHASKPDQGSTFWFTVPLPRALSPRAASERQVREPEVAGAKILLVEDIPVNQELGRAILMRQGHNVDVAENGKQALAAVQAEAYDLVLMDIQMPVMDGITATKAIRQLTSAVSTVPIIAMTANVLPEQVRSFREAGMNGHVAKPIDQRELTRVMRQMLVGKEQQGRTKDAESFDQTVFGKARDLLPASRLKSHLESLDLHLEQALASKAGDPHLRELAHRLVSQSGMLGFVEVSRWCNELQNATEETAASEDAFDALKAAAQKARAKMPELVASL